MLFCRQAFRAHHAGWVLPRRQSRSCLFRAQPGIRSRVNRLKRINAKVAKQAYAVLLSHRCVFAIETCPSSCTDFCAREYLLLLLLLLAIIGGVRTNRGQHKRASRLARCTPRIGVRWRNEWNRKCVRLNWRWEWAVGAGRRSIAQVGVQLMPNPAERTSANGPIKRPLARNRSPKWTTRLWCCGDGDKSEAGSHTSSRGPPRG